MADSLDRERMLAPVRFSRLKYIAQSPAHYIHEVTNPRGPSVAMRRGSYTDALLFETTAAWAVFEGSRRGKAWDAFELANTTKQTITQAEVEPCMEMARSLRRNREAMELLGDGVRQQTLGWKFLGRECAGTPDVRNASRVVDLKTTRSADPRRFVRDGLFRAYHAQLAWYLDAVSLCGVGKPSEAYIVAVESTPPHPVTVLRLTDNAIDAGRRACRLWLERLIACEQADHWPGYVECSVDFDVETEVELTFGEETE